jgi:hypothetical protein
MATRLRIIRTLPPTPAGPVFEAAEAEGDDRWILWAGTPPEGHIEEESGIADGDPMWRVHLPSGVLLSDLPLPLPTGDAAKLVASLALDLATLHRAGHTHGELQAHRIGLSVEGEPLLLGAGTCPGTVQTDIDGLRSLHQALTAQAPDLPEGDADAIHEALVAWIADRATTPSTVRALVRRARSQVPEDARVISFATKAIDGKVDEVGFELGPDESAGGLFDPWTTGDITSYRSSEATGTLADPASIDGEHQAVLGQLAAQASTRPGAAHYATASGQPDEAIMALIADEPLDPLPVPDSLPLPNPMWMEEPESTGEVTISGAATMDDVTVVSTIFELERSFTGSGIDGATDPRGQEEDQAATRTRFWIFVAGVVITLALATSWISATFQ